MSTFHTLTVDSVRQETRDAIVVTLAVPPEAAGDFAFIQGQYLTLRAEIGGEDLRRSYSICSGVDDGALRIGIKRVAGGRFSTWAQDALVPGAAIEVMPPQGRFHVPLDAGADRHYVGFAVGSGITPILSILRSVLSAEPASRFTLIYGNRASSGVMFGQELADLKDLYLERLSIVHVMSREPQEIELFNGRIDGAKCREIMTRWLSPGSVDVAFICGPEDMTREVSATLEELGVPRAAIKTELFGIARPAGTARPLEAGTGTVQATAVIDGRALAFGMAKGAETLLDAALRQGIELPYSCKAGVCSTCRAKLVEGDVDMDVHFGLEDYEIARGYILTCQSYAACEKLVVDFDDQQH
ncbi:1,2-phenylacetyl-CoA epoxidase subunit PaaE [Zavarzinia compransoris]|uniref:Phenylacetate-CoA oxygenase/reductase subunit PaaK n=1 Tax=Zavarzinia compransoris TaxID=1264899 RepID=A0A317DVF2_9PROT|nr:1,2-phenylacetyl-CoA epoxidase subunit PaaE [Zavarzinia compransoris]PWR18659.1 phenylacetate-CoA oxygenase/reductase subunit PaaK [Zavarzinia compransoris]TDP40096.1 ring-1,2-phenylacetyl-CoA epoxidase subunit PaaE [Zavarzinia compransoris]